MKELKEALALVDTRKAISDGFDEDSDEADMAYNTYWEAIREAAAQLVKISHGRIEKNVAIRMVIHQRGKILALLARTAA
jgi:hypothetical protein